MKIYFTSKQIPQLKEKGIEERFQAIESAQNKLSAPEKVLLNVLKLCIIVPAFAFVLRVSENWTALLWVALFLLCYPLVLRPIQLAFISKKL